MLFSEWLEHFAERVQSSVLAFLMVIQFIRFHPTLYHRQKWSLNLQCQLTFLPLRCTEFVPYRIPVDKGTNRSEFAHNIKDPIYPSVCESCSRENWWCPLGRIYRTGQKYRGIRLTGGLFTVRRSECPNVQNIKELSIDQLLKLKQVKTYGELL